MISTVLFFKRLMERMLLITLTPVSYRSQALGHLRYVPLISQKVKTLLKPISHNLQPVTLFKNVLTN